MNLKVRLRNPIFWIQLLLGIFATHCPISNKWEVEYPHQTHFRMSFRIRAIIRFSSLDM